MIESLKHSYSDGIYNKRIAILGNYPPPLGGVSVHIQRVMHKFKQQGNTVHHFDTSNFSPLPFNKLRDGGGGNFPYSLSLLKGRKISAYLYTHLKSIFKVIFKLQYTIRLISFLLFKRPQIVYYHTVDLNRRFVEFKLLLIAKKILRYELVIVEHSCRHLAQRSLSAKKTFNTYMAGVDRLVLIGYSTWQSYIDNHIFLPKATTIEAAFLPPDVFFESKIIATYPLALHEFFKSHFPIILINAFQLSFVSGKDLYGMDLTIDALVKLSKEYSKLGFLYVFAQISDQEISLLKNKLEHLGLLCFAHFLTGHQELWPLFKKADLFVRPTRSDGESVSVQEALYFNVPVVASDACKRPDGVIIFQSGNAQDFYQKINQVLCKNIKGNVNECQPRQ